MKAIKTQLDLEKMIDELSLEMDETSDYALIQKGFDTEEDAINIVFDKYNLNHIKRLLAKSGYYQQSQDFLIGKNNDNWELISIKDVIYIEGLNNDTYIHVNEGEYKVKQKLYELELQLKSKLFVRVSKSYIVSVHHIKRIKPHFNGKLILHMRDHTKIEVTRHYVTDFRTVLGM